MEKFVIYALLVSAVVLTVCVNFFHIKNAIVGSATIVASLVALAYLHWDVNRTSGE